MSAITLPYWIIILIAIVNIITILLESSTKKDGETYTKSGTRTLSDIKSRDKLSIIPRIYFVIIYTMFWLSPEISLDIKAVWGRWGIFSILFIDSYCHLANYIDYHWYTILKILRLRK